MSESVSDSSSESVGDVEQSNNFAYDDEPLAEAGDEVRTPDDPDGILPSTLEERNDVIFPLNEWRVTFFYICSLTSCFILFIRYLNSICNL